MDAEKRRALRYPADFGVVCRTRGQQYDARALNLSQGGLLISTQHPLTTGSVIEVSFALPGAQSISLKAMVRHASEDGGVGIEFVEVLPSYRANLVSYLEALDCACRAAAGWGP